MKRKRVIAYVTRERDDGRELLVFDHRDHPKAGTQVPAGRLDPGEDLEAGLLREVREETGLENLRVVRRFGIVHPASHGQRYENHAFELEVEEETPDAWEHAVTGKGDDEGLVFLYRWVPLEPPPLLWGAPDAVIASLTGTPRSFSATSAAE